MMNHINKRNQLKSQLKSYKDFIPICPGNSFPKMVNEMMKIHCELEKIRQFTLEQLVSNVDYKLDTLESKLNF